MSRRPDTLSKRISDGDELLMEEREELAALLGYGCPQSTKHELYRKLGMLSLFKNAGLFDRVQLFGWDEENAPGGHKAQYVPGQDASTEIPRLRNLVRSMGYKASR